MPFSLPLSSNRLWNEAPLPGADGWLPGANGWLPGANEWLLGANEWLLGANEWLPGASEWLPGASGWLPGASGWLPGASEWLPGADERLPGAESYATIPIKPRPRGVSPPTIATPSRAGASDRIPTGDAEGRPLQAGLRPDRVDRHAGQERHDPAHRDDSPLFFATGVLNPRHAAIGSRTRVLSQPSAWNRASTSPPLEEKSVRANARTG